MMCREVVTYANSKTDKYSTLLGRQPRGSERVTWTAGTCGFTWCCLPAHTTETELRMGCSWAGPLEGLGTPRKGPSESHTTRLRERHRCLNTRGHGC